MLRNLYISNFALIQEMDVKFPGHLTVITGETGAGKSIFLEALGLVLGKRADSASLQDKKKKCIIEAEFDVKGVDLKQFFEEEGLDADNLITLRREISPEGRSRSFLNDTPVSLTALKYLSEKLVDVHSQHQTLLLNQSNFQLELLDAFAGTVEAFKQYKKEFSQLGKLKQELDTLETEESAAAKELDYYTFLFTELNESTIEPGLLLKLEEESNTLEHAETIKGHLSNAYTALSGGESNLLSGLAQIKQTLAALSKFGPAYKELSERVNSAYIELKELSNDLENAESEVVFDPMKLNEVNGKMDQLNRLLKKHGVKTEEELIRVKDEVEAKLSSFNSLESRIAQIKKQITKLESDCRKKAEEISQKRSAGIIGIEKKVKEILSDLSMQNATFKIDLSQADGIGGSGLDHLKFLFSANKGGTLNEIQKVASGGELSRLMLALKSMLAAKKQLPSIIFDEIDTGVSGDVADKIGGILKKMGEHMQVITITHLPQIASKGQHHLFVYKKDEDEKTVSFIRDLNSEERVVEIAKMLSTGNPTQSALKNAKELLKA